MPLTQRELDDLKAKAMHRVDMPVLPGYTALLLIQEVERLRKYDPKHRRELLRAEKARPWFRDDPGP